jgi:hypothetical protein
MRHRLGKIAFRTHHGCPNDADIHVTKSIVRQEPSMPSDVVDFQGRLSFENRLAAVLERIVERPQEGGIAILRLTDDVSNRTGEIGFLKGKYVCRAVLREKSSGQELCSGYEALRLVCGIASADYVYLTNSKDFGGDLNLNIDLQSVIKLLPNLPEDRTELQNDEFMLNRIFGTTTTRERIPAMPMPSNVTSSTDMSSDGWKAAARTPLVPWADGSSMDRIGASSGDIDDTETTQSPSLQERAQQEIGDVPEPGAPQLSQAQRLLQRPTYFAMNVITATAQVTKVAAIIVAIFVVIGGLVYSIRHAFQIKPSLPQQQHAAAPAVRQTPLYIKHSTRVFAVRKPASAAAQSVPTRGQSSGVPGVAEPGRLTPDATPHRRAYQTYP